MQPEREGMIENKFRLDKSPKHCLGKSNGVAAASGVWHNKVP
jgi:hypothetical protein